MWSDLVVSRRGRGPLAVFLPAYGRQGAALLRIHNIAAALGAHGWRRLVLPHSLTLEQRRRLLAAACPDVVVMQGARHPLNRPELYPGVPVIYDMDDADFHLPHLAGPVARAMSEVAGVMAGSRYIAEWCRKRGARADVVWTATPESRRAPVPHAARPPVVAWAQTTPWKYTAEADLVLQVMARVAARCPEVRLRLYDRPKTKDEAFADRFRQAGIRTEWLGTVNYRDYLKSFDDVALGLAPLCPENEFTRGKSFGKVLAYLDRRVPVIASDACEHGAFFDGQTGVITNDPAIWVNQALSLLRHPEARTALADAAFDRFRTRLTVAAAAAQADRFLRTCLAGVSP